MWYWLYNGNIGLTMVILGCTMVVFGFILGCTIVCTNVILSSTIMILDYTMIVYTMVMARARGEAGCRAGTPYLNN